MPIKITFQQLVDEFSASTGRTKAFSNQFIKDIFTTIQEGLRRDENVNIKGLGIFKLQDVSERETVNPKTGKPTLIEAHKKVVFRPEKPLREKVNEKYAKLKTKKIKKKEPKPTPAPAPVPIVEKPIIFDDRRPTSPPPPPKRSKPTPPTPSPESKKIMPTFVIEEKKKKSAWRWILPLFLIILIFAVVFVIPTKFESLDDLAFWKNWGKDTIPTQPTIVETSTVETVIKPIVKAESIFVKAPLPEQAKETEPVKVKNVDPVPVKPAPKPIVEDEPEEVPHEEQVLIHKVKSGNTLWGLSKQYYSRTSLWPNIYRKNVEVLRTPDLLPIGRELLIPELQGDSFELSKTDSARIAQGYYLAYRAYRKYDPEKAKGYLDVATKFSTTLDE